MSQGKEWWRPEIYASRQDNRQKRAAMRRALRDFFAEQDYAEVETPCLQISPGLEPHLRAFGTQFHDGWGNPPQALYLHTSPEFTMKKLLAAGEQRIYQLARVFRNGEHSPTHHPEFTMLEWYRTDGTLDDLMCQTEQLVQACVRAAGVQHWQRGGRICDPFRPWRRLSVAEAFFDYCDMDVLATAPDPWAPNTALIRREAQRLRISTSDSDHWDDIFFKIMLERIEPHLGFGVPTILHSYPVSMAALARPNAHDPRVADRFEAYGCGVELCNAFGELTDPVEQRRRFEQDMDLKQALYGERYPLDEDLLTALESSFPACCGNALGFDRLVMLTCGAETLEDVLWAPVMTRIQ